ncbi:MAG: DUF3489 domain-containing protein [Bryobacterales bacterium]|nr:DUF3489 domain-containing protein [Bryobacterales bacterium]
MTNEAVVATETAAVAEQGANVAPEKASSKKGASQKKGAPKAKKEAKKAAKSASPNTAAKSAPKSKEKASKKASKAAKTATPREGSKKEIVLDLLRRKDGATMAEIAKATDWQNHSIRGFISGQLTKKMGLTVESSKNDAGERTYHIAK